MSSNRNSSQGSGSVVLRTEDRGRPPMCPNQSHLPSLSMTEIERKHEPLSGQEPTLATKSKERAMRWLDSDLVGIPVTLYTFGVLAISLAAFRFVGGVAGVIVGFALWLPMVLFAIQGRGNAPRPLQVPVHAGPRHRVLVIANQGLDDSALCENVCARAKHADVEAMILAPVGASSRLGDLTDDVDEELALASHRVDVALRTLEAEDVGATGRATIADPVETLLDGLREFPPNEVIMMPGREPRWGAADELVDRVRSEVGLPVTVVVPSVVGHGTQRP